MNYNKVFILGRATKSPEVRSTQGGQSVASFGVATNRYWNDQQGQKQSEVEFHNVVAWGKLAEIAGGYISKGKLVFIQGRIKTRDWQDKAGNKRTATDIIAETIQLGPDNQSPNKADDDVEDYQDGGTEDAFPEEKAKREKQNQGSLIDEDYGEITSADDLPF